MRWLCLLIASAAAMALEPARAGNPCATGFAKLRFEDDVACFRDSQAGDALDTLNSSR